MAVAKSQGRGKPAKTEQRKVQGLELGPQVEQTVLPNFCPNLHTAGPWGGKNIQKEEPRGKGSFSLSPICVLGRSSLRIFGSTCPHPSRMDFPAIF